MKNPLLSANTRAGFDKFYAGELGQCLMAKTHLIKAVYSFAVDGGSVSAINLNDVYGNEIKIPSGAIVKSVIIDRATACTSAGGNGTVALSINSANDLLSAVDADTLSAIHAGVPISTASTVVKATADRKLVLTIGTEALTAGVLNIYLEIFHVA